MRTKSYVSSELSQLIIQQISKEQYNANLYLAMCSFFDNKGLKNTSKWFKHQYEEETNHGKLLFDYLIDSGISVCPIDVSKPVVNGSTSIELIDQYSQAERDTTDSIKKMCDQALDESDLIYQQKDEEGESTLLQNVYKLSNNEVLSDHQVPDLFPSFFK